MDKSFCTKVKKAVEPVGENIIVAVILLFLGIMVGPASAATLTVDDSGGANYTKIQDAINNASDGDTILVYSGIYHERVNVNKQLTLQGIDNGMGKPVVDADGWSDPIRLSAGWSTLEGFIAINAGYASAGIAVNSNNNIIKNNNASNSYWGIHLYESNNNTLSGNKASGNQASGIRLSYSSNNNTLNSNYALNNPGGIILYESSNNTLSNNYALNNGEGIFLDSSSNNTIFNNYFNNTNNAFDNRNNIWNITKTSGKNIIGGLYLGGNFWSDYIGNDTDGDGLGDTMLPYTSSGGIANGGDYLPLIAASGEPTQIDSCTVISSPGEYVLNRSIINSDAMNCITITSSNVIFDGTGYIIDGIDAQDAFGFPLDTFGVFVYNSTTALINVTVKNLTATDWKSGVFYKNITDGMVENNTVTSNQYGIYLQFSSNNMLSNNNANFNRYDSIFLISSNNNTLSSNNISNNDAGIRIDSSISNTFNRNIASRNNYGIILQFSSNNMLSNNFVLNNDFDGIFLQALSNNNTLSNNNALNNGFGGIKLTGSNNNTLSGNSASSERFSDGIFLEFSNNNTLSDNNVSNNNRGIHLGASGASSNNNMISVNNALNNFVGIFLESSSNNIVTNNNFSNNLYHGIEIYGDNNTLNSNNVSSNGAGIEISANNNLIYNNYFFNNVINARDSGKNTWNIAKIAGTNIIGGPYLGGNYWSDYSGKDTDEDGLGDTLLPYNSSGNITNGGDFLPLTITPIPTAGSISGFKINDTNGNGKWDAGEAGIRGWKITLKNITTGEVIASNLTDTNGFYKFANLVNGSYNVTEEIRTGFTHTNATFKLINVADQNVMNLNFTNQPLGYNLIKNPGFESGTSPWLFYTNGTGKFTAAPPGYEGSKSANIIIYTGGTNIQLYQKGILLEPHTRYRLSFAAYSTTGRDLKVALIKHISPFTRYGLDQKFNLSKDWQEFSTEFTTSGFSGTVNDGRLMFFLAPYAKAGDRYYIDDVWLEKI